MPLLSSLFASFQSNSQKVAIEDEKGSYSYEYLNHLSQSIAIYLAEQGISQGQIVGIQMQNRKLAIASIIALLKSGCTYLPLDPVYPEKRLQYMVKNADCQFILSDIQGLNYSSQTIVLINELDFSQRTKSPEKHEQSTTIDVEANAPTLAYIIYTSGSTGDPKGVMMKYEVVDNLIQWQNNQYPANATFRTAQFSQLSFDVSFQEIFATLCSGSTLILLPEQTRRDFKSLLEYLIDHNVERIFMPYIALLHLSQWAVRLQVFPQQLLHVITAGEQLIINEEIKQFFQQCNQAKLYNQYGPSETHVVTQYEMPQQVNRWPEIPPIGKPIDGAKIILVADAKLQTSNSKQTNPTGEIYIAGEVLAEGYINNQTETEKRFTPITYQGQKVLAYKTGDIAEELHDGNFVYKDRIDNQVKINGYRVETSEVEAALLSCADITQVAVAVAGEQSGKQTLVGFLVLNDSNYDLSYVKNAQKGSQSKIQKVRAEIAKSLPEYMIPEKLVAVAELLKTPSGKIDRRSMLANFSNTQSTTPNQSVQLDRQVTQIICEALNLTVINPNISLVDAGMSSLKANTIAARFYDELALDIPAYRLFQYASIQIFLNSLSQTTSKTPRPQNETHAERHSRQKSSRDIAIIGMSVAVPGANTLAEFWHNLIEGKESITFSSAAKDLQNQSSDEIYARGLIQNPTEFDAAFFAITPVEAEFIDPQQRLLLEQSWLALEDAGIVVQNFAGQIGVFCGVGNNSYYLNNILQNTSKLDAYGKFQAMIANEKDYTATRISHKLNLTGPSLSIVTACSTSLVAVVTAVQSLREGTCDMAIAGAASLTFPQQQGYQYQEGGIFSKDGHTRTFDANASGTVFSDGCAVVVLKRLDYAIADNDQIYAVIKGAAINNDGAAKGSFSAPSIDGQKNVILSAMIDADVDAKNMDYIEAHGTATPLGDPIEIAALQEAFENYTENKNFCGIGSLKSNLGHLTAAAGAAGLIKTALMLKNKRIVPSLHFTQINPAIDIQNSPFYITNQMTNWPKHKNEFLAGVSSFGVGGTNAHVILANYATADKNTNHPLDFKLPVCISAKSCEALQAYIKQYQDYFNQLSLSLTQTSSSFVDPNDIAVSILQHRTAFDYRASVVIDDLQQASFNMEKLQRRIDSFGQSVSQKTASKKAFNAKPFTAQNIVYLFPGQGTQTFKMGCALYENIEIFRVYFDQCNEILQNEHGIDIFNIIHHQPSALNQTALAQPALFVIGYSLAQTLNQLDINPTHCFGHSIGELVAATIAEVFDLATAIKVIVTRGKVMQAQPAGDMLAVHATLDDIQPYLTQSVVIAAYNTEESNVLSGPSEEIENIARQLNAKQIETRQLVTSHAFHSPLMVQAEIEFIEALQGITLAKPIIPFISCVSGTWIKDSEAQDIGYWARQIVSPVKYYQGSLTLNELSDTVYLELGPRQVLSGFLMQNLSDLTQVRFSPAMINPGKKREELNNFATLLGQLWEFGLSPNWSLLIEQYSNKRVKIPTYPFQRKTFKIQPLISSVHQQPAELNHHDNILDSFNFATINLEQATVNNTLIDQLKSLFSDASGLDLTQAGNDEGFFELGLDSLFLTQAALQVKKVFKVKVTFRQLLNECGTFSDLANYLAEQGVNLAPPAQPPIANNRHSPDHQAASMQAKAVTQNTQAILPQQTGIQQQASIPQLTTVTASLNAGAHVDINGLTQLLSQHAQLLNSQTQLLTQALGQQNIPLSAITAAQAAPHSVDTAQQASASTVLPSNETTAKTGVTGESKAKPFGASVRINVKRSNELTSKQQSDLQALSDRYNEKFKSSKSFAQENRKQLADPRVVSGFRNTLKEIIYPIVVEKSAGAYLWDIDGNQFIDITCGFGSNFFGNGADFIRESVAAQLQQGYEIGPQNPLVAEVSKGFCEMTGLDRVAFCNTGSEAVLGAIRLARTVTAKDKIVMFDEDYHGINDEVIVNRNNQGTSIAAAAGIPQAAVSETVILDYGQDSALDYIREHADEIAAVLVEPVQSRNPSLQPKAFLEKLRAICTENEMALIFDEVITGFRIHPKGAQGYFGIQADLATYGKVIGGGMPIGVIAGASEYMDALDGGYWQYGDDSAPEVGVTYFAGTFVRHPLALAAAKAVLKKLKAEPEIQKNLNQKTTQMVKTLNDYCQSVGVPIKIASCGSLFKIKIPQEIPYEELLYVLLREKGIHIWDARPCFLTTAHSDKDIAQFINQFKAAIDEMLDMDFLPSEKPKAAKTFNAEEPPVAGARLGKDRKGNPAWFIEDPERPGKYLQMETV
ncbi:amino acid adenylation domain-containing protein [Aliikangiella maris]|uniref:Amino acid adenylation domain-containing protein n=2 Tax=Aliikangiella maris TaxID=3162458 RepID=A0ABV3MR88_9GAMM